MPTTPDATGMNGAGNGVQQQQQVQINPLETARAALMFLARAEMRAHERTVYAQCELLLQALADGLVVLAPPPPSAPASADPPQGA